MATTSLPLESQPAKQASALPTRKVNVGSVAGAIATIVVFMFNTYVLPHDKPLTAKISVAITTVLSFAISYFVPPAASDQVTSA